MKKILKTLSMAVAMFALCSCSGLTGPRHYELTDKDNGRTLHLDRGDTFTVTLVSNPTTGYQWQFGTPPYDDTVMILRGDKYIRPEEQLAGAPGKRSLSFLAEGSGRTGLRLIYVRPWEKTQPPAKEYNLMVIVKDGTEDEQKKGPPMRRNSKGELVPDRKRSVLE